MKTFLRNLLQNVLRSPLAIGIRKVMTILPKIGFGRTQETNLQIKISGALVRTNLFVNFALVENPELKVLKDYEDYSKAVNQENT